MHKYLYCILIFFSVLPFGESQITANITLSKDTLAVGEEVEMTISLTVPNIKSILGVDLIQFDSIKSQVKTSDIPDSLLRETYAEVEWEQKDDTEDRFFKRSKFVISGKQMTKKFKLRFWDIGVFKLPELNVIQDSTRLFRVAHLQTPVVLVFPPRDTKGNQIAPIDTTQALFPIASILSESKTWEDFIWVIYLLAAIVTLLLIAYMIYRSKHGLDEEEEELIEVIRPAHEISLEKLDSLKTKELWQQGKVKEYQSELTYIIREYLENRFDIKALESTTDEIARDLKKRDFDEDQEDNLKQILQIADLVKFAKAKPPADIHDKFYSQAVDFVEATKKIIQQLGEEDGLDQ